MLRLGLPNSGYQTASRLQRPLICSRPRQQHNCYSAAHLHRPASYAQLQATAAAMRKAKGPQGSGVVKALAGDGCGSVGSGSGGGSRGGCGGGGAGMGGAGMGGAGSPDDDNVSRLLSSMQECAGLGLTVTALSDPESFKESVQRVPDAKAQLQVIMQDWISQHPDGAVGVLFDASGLMFCGDPIIKMASLVGGMERTFAVVSHTMVEPDINVDGHNAFNKKQTPSHPDGYGCHVLATLLYASFSMLALLLQWCLLWYACITVHHAYVQQEYVLSMSNVLVTHWHVKGTCSPTSDH